jgi:hypothetical protein
VSETDIRIVDRTSMYIHFDKKYTTHEKRPPLKTLILFTNLKVDDLPNVLRKKPKTFKQYSARVVSLGTAFYRVTLQRTIGLRQIRNEVIIDAGCKGVWVVLTEGDSYFVAHVLETLFDRLYPYVSKLHLNYSQMRYLLKILQDSCDGKTTLTYFTIKRINPETQHEGTQILWDKDVDNDIKLLLSLGFTVKVARLDFELRDKDNAVLKVQISRKGLCKLQFGSFSSFYQNVVLNAIEYGLSQEKFYDKRERSVENGNVELHPLRISYGFAVRRDQLERFVKKITNQYSCSVIHGGNPYFVADLCDYRDGSSFGVAILGNAVTLTPMARATSFAVWRLVGEVQEILGDGDIAEVQTR